MSIDKVFTFHYNQDSSRNWSSDSGINEIFLRQTQNYVNDCLHNRGHVFLNEILDHLGLSRIGQGQLQGWRLSNNIEFVLESDGKDGEILITLVTEGVIYDKI